MPRTSLPKGNALIRKISRKNDTSSHPKGNALIRQISRGNRMKNRLSPQPAGPGRTVQDAIVLDDDDDDQGNDLANVAKPEEMEADLEITGMNVDIILVRAPPNPEPFDANAMPPPPMVRQGFRHNPLHQNAGTAADQPISLLDSDSDDTAATAVPRPTQSRPVAAGKAKVIQETLLRTADKAISASGRKRKIANDTRALHLTENLAYVRHATPLRVKMIPTAMGVDHPMLRVADRESIDVSNLPLCRHPLLPHLAHLPQWIRPSIALAL
ncbi:hypothetical protein CALVIDRAFT_249070 [Calocera viscosa TUFC12733]|uniref:Uncharacterized protein n=1 Tax=Calocera viscosa (strain TUFC12733) TaxID=1330018 RepID=A0A167JCL8_CALVF|nr:hypothetical protein CALVIDRAFT_249070 [Calocera viscosa TUFC12733]